MNWEFVAIAKKHQRELFDCGNSVLNDYLKRYARQNHERGVAKAIVAVPTDSLRINGYYTLSSSLIEYASLPTVFQRKVPAYPIPAILIGKLAVDRSVQGQGLGKELLADALYRTVRVAKDIGIFAVRVDAIDRQAKEFYLKYEFVPFRDRELSLFLPMTAILKMFD